MINKRLVIIISIFTALTVFLIANPDLLNRLKFWDPRYSPKACERDGGRWQKFPGRTIPEFPNGNCFYPTEDEGKQCYQDSDCVKDCVMTGVDDEGFYVGKCGVYSIFDCAPTIPSKTKDRDMLKSGSCV